VKVLSTRRIIDVWRQLVTDRGDNHAASSIG
jgi:hypothetical protein